MATNLKKQKSYVGQRAVAKLLVCTTLFSAVSLNGCQPGRQQSAKPESFLGLPDGSTEQQVQQEAWRLLREDGIPTQKSPQIRSIFDHLVGVAAPSQSNPSQSNLFTAADVDDVAELSELQATYQKLWCDISQYVQPVNGKYVIREGLTLEQEQDAIRLKDELWTTYNKIQEFSLRQDLQQKLSDFVGLSRPAESASSMPKIIPLFDTSASSVVENPVVRENAAKEIQAMLAQNTRAQIGSTQKYPTEPVKPMPKPKPEPKPVPIPDVLPPGAPDSCSNSMLILPPPVGFFGGGSGGDGTYYVPYTSTISVPPGGGDNPYNPPPPPPGYEMNSVPGPSLVLGLLAVFGWARKIKQRIKQARHNVAKKVQLTTERPAK